ncbi:hypothetical protein LguiA_031817 [Lonicera macranthoides]
MDSQKTIASSLLLFSFSLLLVTTTSLCLSSVCSRGELVVRFPFRLKNFQPRTCAYPGFDLSCTRTNQTVLELPNSGQFIVQGIDYATQEIWINDPSNCLPRRILTLNLSKSPFSSVYNQNFMLFNCSSDYIKYRLNPIECLSGTNHTVFATSSSGVSSFLASVCDSITTISVPVQWPFFEQVLSSDLSADLRLGWGAPNCRRCESRGGRCGFKNNSSQEIECKSVTQRGLPRSARYALSIGAGVPALILIVGLICFICSRVKSRGRRRHLVHESAFVVAPQPTLSIGLEKETIDSYPKTILGESRRLPKPDDITCPICLSEYKPKETLRSIPECQHCFHADCIDEWLHRNATCPVCRNSPSRSLPSQNFLFMEGQATGFHWMQQSPIIASLFAI